MVLFLKLLGAAMVSVVLSCLLYLLKRKTAFGKIPRLAQQIIIGIIFGGAAIFGTEFGVDIGTATANARDAAPLCAGIFFGAPAGIIAGFIGGIERWFAVAWGAGMYSRLACSVSTILAGFYAAFLRKFMFENKRPNAFLAFASGAIMEVIHMTILFLTHLDGASQCLEIVQVCTMPMVICNGLSVLLSTIAISLLSNEVHKRGILYKNKKTISQMIQIYLLICVVVSFMASSLFIYVLQYTTTRNNVNRILTNNLNDVHDSLMSASGERLLSVAKNVSTLIDHSEVYDLQAMKEEYGVTEIHIVSKDGTIIESTVAGYVGTVNINKCDEVISDFNVLNNGETEYVSEFVKFNFNEQSYENGERCFAGIALKDGGFVMVGMNRVDIGVILSDTVSDLTTNRRVGETGYVIIADAKGAILSDFTGHDGTNLKEIGIPLYLLAGDSGSFTRNVYGEKCKCMYSFSVGYYIISVMTYSEAYDAVNVNIYINSYMEIIIFAVMFVLIYSLIKRVVVNDIYKVNDSLGHIVSGNLNEVVDARQTFELSKLSDDINQTVDYLKEYISEAEKRMEQELLYAKTIQHSVLPSTFPAFPNVREFNIYATMDTAKEVGGDFYDFYMLDDERLAILMADVSGKGIPAAMFMMNAKTLIRNLAETGLEPNDVFTRANERLCENNEAGMFVTAWMGVLNIKTGHLKYTNAGHNPPVFYKKDGGFSYIKCKPGFILAGMDGMIYKLAETDIEPGDRIFLYTDGVTEATDSDKQLYGEDRLVNFLNNNAQLPAEGMLKAVKESIDEFVGPAEQFDDITMLMVDYFGTDSGTESVAQ